MLASSLRDLTVALAAFAPRMDEGVSEPLPHLREGVTWADLVGTTIGHEMYHIGQIGLLRRLLNKPGLF